MANTALVCDVDNTILDTRPRVRRCLEAIGRGEVFAKTNTTYGGFKAYLSPEEADAFWQLFLSNRYLGCDIPLPDAAQVLDNWCDRGTLIYLTGRHDAPGDSMRTGTLGWLKRHGYPVPDGQRVRLQMKPKRALVDLDFKRDALETLAAQYDLVAGLGDLPQEGPLYAAFGLRPILVSAVGMFSEDELQNAHPAVAVAGTWRTVETLLLNEN